MDVSIQTDCDLQGDLGRRLVSVPTLLTCLSLALSGPRAGRRSRVFDSAR